MKAGRIIHQQVFQLRWHFLACLGLMMVLPLEEAFVNLKDGAGFYSSAASMVDLWIAPLLAGLIACANVQADLEDRRYLFWRSKPVRTWIFILLKYLAGLGMTFVIMAVPALFMWISCTICKVHDPFPSIHILIPAYLPIPIMTYSLCFFSNVLIRKTARAWLIGMAAAGFVLLVPFFLPLDFRAYVRNQNPMLIFIYPAVATAAALAALVLSLWAVRQDWHLRTNLKGLVWAVAVILFALMMYYGRQIANLKVLDETKGLDPYLSESLNPVADRVLMGFHYEIKMSNHRISIRDYHAKPYWEVHDQWMTMPPEYEADENLDLRMVYPSRWPSCYYQIGDDTFAFGIFAYILEEKEPDKSTSNRYYKKLYVRSFQFQEGLYVPVSTAELSDLLEDEHRPMLGMRVIDDKLIILINRSCVAAEVSDTGTLKILEKYTDYMRTGRRLDLDRQREFSIPLVPAEQISMEERIKLSIDWNHWRYGFFGNTGGVFSHTITYSHDNVIHFCVPFETDLARYEVVRWDDQSIYCRFLGSRPFTFLEQMFEPSYKGDFSFVKGGKLYLYSAQKVMVFDVRGKRGIRKLGHFERISKTFAIQDLEVFEDGSILLSAAQSIPVKDKSARGDYEYTGYLYLLENPE